MVLKTVRVPVGLEALFARAEAVVSRYFQEREDHPERGTIEIFGERYLLVRAASLSVEFFALVGELYGKHREAEADDFARNILYDLAHAIGKQDARNFHTKMHLDDPIARMSAGPVHFSHAGWALVDILPGSNPAPGPDYHLVYDHPYSFESDAWLHAGRSATFPVCIMNAGYSSGWCEESFGMPLVATEVLCRARGDDACRFVMAAPASIEPHVARYVQESLPASAHRGAYQIPDFFARKRVEEDLRRRFAEEIAEREAAETKLRQAQKLEAVGRLAGGIAHDFNNLMAIVVTRASLLDGKLAADDPMRADLEHIIAAGERAANLTRQLLAFSRAQVLDREPLELNAVVSELARLLGAVIGEHVELELSLDPRAGWIEADRGQLEQVIMNLVVNARDAMPGGGRLTIATARRPIDPSRTASDLPADHHAVLEVTDRGPGMSAETLARVFEPFFTTKEAGGSGLGLATVYGIVEQSGGHIEAASELGRGSQFTVMLPQIAPPLVREPVPVPAPRPPAAGGSILLVEDNESVRDALAEYLRGEGFRVLVAASGPEAMSLARDPSVAVDLLLTDVVMPRLGGRELAMALRAGRPALRVLFMSGYSPDTTLLDGLGNAALIAKPFRPEAVVAKLREMLA